MDVCLEDVSHGRFCKVDDRGLHLCVWLKAVPVPSLAGHSSKRKVWRWILRPMFCLEEVIDAVSNILSVGLDREDLVGSVSVVVEGDHEFVGWLTRVVKDPICLDCRLNEVSHKDGDCCPVEGALRAHRVNLKVIVGHKVVSGDGCSVVQDAFVFGSGLYQSSQDLPKLIVVSKFLCFVNLEHFNLP